MNDQARKVPTIDPGSRNGAFSTVAADIEEALAAAAAGRM